MYIYTYICMICMYIYMCVCVYTHTHMYLRRIAEPLKRKITFVCVYRSCTRKSRVHTGVLTGVTPGVLTARRVAAA